MTDPAPQPTDPAEEDELLDLRYLGQWQIACSGADLLDLLNCDEGVGPDLYARLGLTPHTDDSLGFDWVEFDEIDEGAYYALDFPEGTDFADFSVAQALRLEEISEKCFNDLPTGDEDDPCDGDCDHCPQDCIGKIPVTD
ncbi:MAG TPA: hypothetical protein IAC79_08130 [Candidatus Spyradenecus faecavium]|uniref:Uncharacterized protein n=1 Tax=Candidatus Spyradenecus faecavium TaxID=2840947 RepID=A0A9D1T3T5_9BACT|nr:hypothetical protein [Candidatus Spyradenecus faecavium]